MKLTLAKFTFCASLSEETNAYTAIVHVNGEPAFHASNRGTGGCDMYNPIGERGRILLRDAEAWAKTLPPAPARYGLPELAYNLQLAIGDLVADKIIGQDMKRGLNKKALFLHEGKLVEVGKKGIPVAQAIAFVQKKYPEATILNLLPFEAALAIYKQH